MAGLLYYWGKRDTGVTPPELVAGGLGYAFDAESPIARVGCGNGPDGAYGVIIADDRHTAGKQIGYYPDAQRWVKLPGIKPEKSTLEEKAGELWVGCWKDSPPTPEQLQREQMLDGHWVMLGDGQRYMSPVARRLQEQAGQLTFFNPLPKRIRFDDDGNPITDEVLGPYAALWPYAEKWWEQWRSVISVKAVENAEDRGEPIEIVVPFEEQAAAALCAITTNYRVGMGECNLLGLLTEESMGAVLGALIDLPTLKDYAKKNTRQTAGG